MCNPAAFLYICGSNFEKQYMSNVVKVNSSAKKRFKVTGSGKIKRKHAYKRHILTKKSTRRKRNLSHSTLVSDADMNNVKAMLRL